MASKQKSGLYRTKIKIGVDAEGKPINKWISGKTKRELEEVRQQVIRHYITGDSRSDDKLFGKCAIEWYAQLQQAVERGDRSDSTLDSYKTALNKDILPVFGNRHMRAISSNDLQQFVNQFAKMSATKITYITASLDNIFQYACQSGILTRNPFDFVNKPGASESTERRALTESERKRVIEVSRTHPRGAYLGCMYYLGARPGEIRGLQWGDIDWEKGLVHVQRDIDYKKKGPDKTGALKNAKSNRFVPVPAALRDILLPLSGAHDEFIFSGSRHHNALARSTADRMWIELMVACDLAEALPPGSNNYRESDPRSKHRPLITPHTMRHNYVTMCWESGIDVYTASKLVGHKSITTTMSIYTHLSERQMGKAISQVSGMFDS